MRKNPRDIPYYQWDQFLALSVNDRKNYISTLVDIFEVPLILIESLVLEVPKRSMSSARRFWKNYGYSPLELSNYSCSIRYRLDNFFAWVNGKRMACGLPPAPNYLIETSLSLCVPQRLVDDLDIYIGCSCDWNGVRRIAHYRGREGCILDGVKYKDIHSGEGYKAIKEKERAGLDIFEIMYAHDYRSIISLDLTCSPEMTVMILNFLRAGYDVCMCSKDRKNCECRIVSQSFTIAADQER